MILMPQMRGFAGGSSGAKTIELVHTESNASFLNDVTSATYTGCNLGTPASDRDIFITCAAMTGYDYTEVVSVDVGGVAATKLYDIYHTVDGDWRPHLSFWKARVPSGTTADVTFTTGLSTEFHGPCMGLYRAIGFTGLDDSDEHAIPDGGGGAMMAVSGAEGGAILACSFERNGSGFDWTNVTKDFQADTNTSDHASVASRLDLLSTATYYPIVQSKNTGAVFLSAAAIAIS